MSISPARTSAFDALRQIDERSAFSSEVLPIVEKGLSDADRSLCHDLTLGSLRRQIRLDREIDRLTQGRKLDAAVRIALRLGLYQLRFLDRVPAYSAINDSVDLIRRAGKSSASGLINAILRRATREDLPLEYGDDIDEIVVDTSHPRWLVNRWIADFGRERAESICIANNVAPGLTFRITQKGLKSPDRSQFERFDRSKTTDNCYFVSGQVADVIQMAEDGVIYLQDEASMIVADSIDLKEDELFLDACAAPGSKFGRLGHPSTFNRIAGDQKFQRILTMKNSLAKQGVTGVGIVQYDAVSSFPFADESFDVVLVDAPCSGTGTIRHNPEICYSLVPDDFGRHAGKQLDMLVNASKLVKKGGRIIYSTCSIERQENEDVINEFTERVDGFMVEPPKIDPDLLTDEGFARTWADRDPMDGFFVANLTRG